MRKLFLTMLSVTRNWQKYIKSEKHLKFISYSSLGTVSLCFIYPTMRVCKTILFFGVATTLVDGALTNSSALLAKISSEFGMNLEDYSYFTASKLQYDSGFKSEDAGQLIFKTEEELFDSEFWRQLQKKKNPQRTSRFVLKIEETGSVYHFGESEQQLPTGAGYLPEWLYTPKRDIELLEVDYGEGVQLSALHVPVSYCKLAELTSGSSSTSLSTSVGYTLSVMLYPMIRMGVAIAGVTLKTGMDNVDLLISNSFSITCTCPQGNRLQIFARINYVTFANARKRRVVYRGDSRSLDSNFDWERIVSSTGKYEDRGLVLYSKVNHPPTLECVNQEQYLQCNSFFDLANDPLQILDYAD